MKDLNIKIRRTIHIKREARIGLLASLLSVFTVLPYLGVNTHWTLSERYIELLKEPVQIFAYILIALFLVGLHLIVQGLFYNLRDFSPSNKKSILINQFIYGIVVIASAYYFFSLPSKFNATIFERFIDCKEEFYLPVVFMIFYWILNILYFNSKYFKTADFNKLN